MGGAEGVGRRGLRAAEGPLRAAGVSPRPLRAAGRRAEGIGGSPEKGMVGGVGQVFQDLLVKIMLFKQTTHCCCICLKLFCMYFHGHCFVVH